MVVKEATDKCEKIANEIAIRSFRHLIFHPRAEFDQEFKGAINSYVDAWLDREIAKDAEGANNGSK
jgi:hypothetical protein